MAGALIFWAAAVQTGAQETSSTGASPSPAASSSATAAPATATVPVMPNVAAPADVASVMHPTGEAHLRKIHDRFLQQIKNDNKIELLFIGDSITQGWSKAPEVWKQYYGKWDTANFGDGGDYTQHVLWRVENGELDGIHPKVVVLLVGINNLYHAIENYRGPGNNAAQVAAGIKKILDTIHEKLPETKVLLLGVFPFCRGKEAAGPRNAGAAVNAIIKNYDDGSKTRYLGIWNQFLQPDGKSASTDVLSDGLHPTPKGYQIWAENMQPLLEEMMK